MMLSDTLSDRLLSPLSKYYGDKDTVEVRMNKPGLIITDRRGEGKVATPDKNLTVAVIETICKAMANRHGLKFDLDGMPKLSCILPGGHRFECLLGSSVRSGISLAIRCKHPFTPTWDQLGATDAVRDYLLEAVKNERNIIISGATNTGKTTLLNMLLATLPDDTRVIAMEDTPELQIDQFWDGNGLLAARETDTDTGSGLMSWPQLYSHLMRITPTHIVYGEISKQNAFAALDALSSGITGFICTIHAESPHQAIHRKFDQNMAGGRERMSRVPEFISELVDVVVQIKRTSDGFRRITDIYEPRNDNYILKDEKAA